VLVSPGERELAAPEDLFAQLRKHEPGETVSARILQAGEAEELEVTLDARPGPGAGR
jgi:S1-C subfamily serine protease